MSKIVNKLAKFQKNFVVEITPTSKYKELCEKALDNKKSMKKACKILSKMVKDMGDTDTWSKKDFEDTVEQIGKGESKGIKIEVDAIYGGPELIDNYGIDR